MMLVKRVSVEVDLLMLDGGGQSQRGWYPSSGSSDNGSSSSLVSNRRHGKVPTKMAMAKKATKSTAGITESLIPFKSGDI